MQKMPLLNVADRDEIGGGRVKRLRLEGFVPTVIYGKKVESVSAKIKSSDLRAAISKYGRNAVFQATLSELDSLFVVIKDIQYNALTEEIMHIDLQSISLTEKRRVGVPIRIIGREALEIGHLVIIQQVDEIQVECLPQETPQLFEIDVSELVLGDNIVAEQIELPENVNLVTEEDQLILSVTEVREIVEDEEVEEEETEEDGEEETDEEDTEDEEETEGN
jgi:large subunit ribosomal protein L25